MSPTGRLARWAAWGGLALLVALGVHPLERWAAVPTWPLEFLVRAWSHGELPLWDPYTAMGGPYFADPRGRAFDPLAALVALGAWAAGSTPSWLGGFAATAWLVCGAVGLAELLRSFEAPRWVRAWAVVVFTAHPAVATVFTEPERWSLLAAAWPALAARCVVARPSFWRGCAFGWLTGLLLLDADLPGRIALGGWIGAFWLGELVANVRAIAWRPLARSLAAALLAGLPMLALAWIAERHALVPSAASLGTALEWRPYLELFTPRRGLGMRGLSLGFLGCAGVWLAWWRRPLRPAVWSAAALGLGLVGPSATPLIGLALVLVASWGLSMLSWIRGADARTTPALVALILTVLGAMWELGAGDWIPRIELMTAMGCVALLAFASPGWRTVAGWALPLVVLATALAGWQRPSGPKPRPPEPGRAAAMVDALPHPTAYRVADFGWTGGFVGIGHGVRDLVGATRPKDPRREHVLEVAMHSSELLAALNVAVAGFERRGGAAVHGSREVAGHSGLYEIERPWPLAFWTNDIRVARDDNEALLELMRPGAPRAVFESADLPDGLRERFQEMDRSGPADPSLPRLIAHRHHRLVFEATIPGSGVFVMSEPMAPGWAARVDGREAPILRVNGLLQAIVVDAGEHEIELVYSVLGLRIAYWAALAWSLVLLLFSFGSAVKRRRDEHATAEHRARL